MGERGVYEYVYGFNRNRLGTLGTNVQLFVESIAYKKTRLGTDWEQTGNRLGTDWEQTGAYGGLAVEISLPKRKEA